jgi:hypothetical protein
MVCVYIVPLAAGYFTGSVSGAVLFLTQPLKASNTVVGCLTFPKAQ